MIQFQIATKQTAIILLIAIVPGLFLSGCNNFLSHPGKISETDSRAQIHQAENLLVAGKFRQAAAIFWAQAEISPSPQKEALQIRAAEAVLQTASRAQAQQYLSAIDERTLNQDLLVRKRVADAELALLNGQAQIALEAVPPNLIHSSEKYKPHLLAVRAKALHRSGQTRQSIETRLILNDYLSKADSLKKNNALIWQSLLDTHGSELDAWTASSDDAELSAWLSLAAIRKHPHKNQASIDTAIRQWRLAHLKHRIPNHIIDSILQDYGTFHIAPDKIALLLPLTGRYRNVAEAIFSGVTTARELGEAFDPPPELLVYDTGDDIDMVVRYYRRAINEGADFIIGPFQKDAIRALASQGALAVPTLSLNYTDDALIGARNLYQFGLLPEDEARQVAERVALENKRAALVLVPESKWGSRLLAAFTKRFQELGGAIIQIERYNPRDADYSVPIKSLLQIDLSEQRKRSVQSIIKTEVAFEPHRRQDADFIFIAAPPQQARLLRPQLIFHYASNLPVYATSHIFSGNENIPADQDINGITYCDMPWILSRDPSIALLKDLLDLQASSTAARSPRLVALGVDAYQIIPHLQRLSSSDVDRYNGTTGKLSLNPQNRIYRELMWAKFEKGLPQPLDAIPDDSARLQAN